MQLIVPRPRITSFNLVTRFRFIPVFTAYTTNLILNGSNGQSGRTYFTLMNTNIAQPLDQWRPVATNFLNADGDFSLTNTVVAPAAAQVFFTLQAQ